MIALIQIIRFEEQLVLVVLFVSVEALVVLDGDGVVIVAVVEAGEDAGVGFESQVIIAGFLLVGEGFYGDHFVFGTEVERSP